MNRFIQRVQAALLVSTAALLLLGCGIGGAARRAQRMNDLKEIGIAYHNYIDALGHAPARVDDLKPYMEGGDKAYQALANGDYVVLWGVPPQEMTEGTANTVLGYEKDAPTNGGVVLMGDASVRQMTAQEFKDAPKATPKKK